MEQPIIEPIDRKVLLAELTPERKMRDTTKASNEIYIFSAEESPILMREVGRLREESFRASGGGTGLEVDVDSKDVAKDGYMQLIVWDPRDEEIVGGYRFIVCQGEHPQHLSTEHYFNFSDKFRKEYLPYTIELGRSFVQVKYQVRRNPKGIFALDNLWDGLGALMVLNPEVKYFFGKITMYTTFNATARNAIIHFMHRHFADTDALMSARIPIDFNLKDPYHLELFSNEDFRDDYRSLLNYVREFNETIPPLFNAYMTLSSTMRTFDTFLNTDFGEVEETGILITIPDIYPDKYERYTNWEGRDEKLEEHRAKWKARLRTHKE